MTIADVALGPMQKVTSVELINAIKEMKLGRAAGLSEVDTEMIAGCGNVRVEVKMTKDTIKWRLIGVEVKLVNVGVEAKTRIRWTKFRECGEVLMEEGFR